MKKFIAVLLPIILIAYFLTGCGTTTSPTSQVAPTSAPTVAPTPTPLPDGYMRNDAEGIRFLKWTEGSGGQLTGYWSTATLNNGQPEYHNGMLTGTQNGQSISLTMNYSIVNVSATGTLAGGVLTLQTPGDNGQMKTAVYRACLLSAYTQALAAFKAKHPAK